MGVKDAIVLPVDGELNTVDPATNRQPGTLVDAIDFNHQYWGPRLGAKQMTWVGRSTTNRIYVGAGPGFGFDGSTTYVKGPLSTEQADLPPTWTLDVVFQMTANRAATEIPVFTWNNTSIVIGVYGTTAPSNQGKVYAQCALNSTYSGATTVYTAVGTDVYAGSGFYTTNGGNVVPTRCYVRLVRTSAGLSLYTIGYSSGLTTTAISDPSVSTYNGAGSWMLSKDTGTGTNTTFSGIVYKAVLRTSRLACYPNMTEFAYPSNPDVKLFVAGTNIGPGTTSVLDYSRFGSHGTLVNPLSITLATESGHYPMLKPVQGMGSFTDQDGGKVSVVMVGGVQFMRRRA